MCFQRERERQREEVKEHWTNKEEEEEEVLVVLMIQQEVVLAGLDGSRSVVLKY